MRMEFWRLYRVLSWSVKALTKTLAILIAISALVLSAIKVDKQQKTQGIETCHIKSLTPKEKVEQA